jgi:phosphoglycolate phosphatase
VNPSDAIYIGDELRDAIAAREAGMHFGAVAWGYATPEALLTRSPDHFFREVAEIAPRLTPQRFSAP